MTTMTAPQFSPTDGSASDPRDAAGRSRAVARAAGVPVADDLRAYPADPQFVERVPIAFARRHGLIGLQRGAVPAGWLAGVGPDDTGSVVVVAASDLTDPGPLDTLGRFLGRPVVPVLSTPQAIATALNAAYQQRTGQARTLIEQIGRAGGAERIDPAENGLRPGVSARRELLAEVERLQAAGAGDEDLLDVASRAPVIKLVNLILFEAVQAGASDVHVQPHETALVVRLRIDGVLYDSFELPKPLQEEVVSRVKVMGHMNIAEKRLAQDGRATVQLGDRSIDLRIATLPTTYGERAVIRLLDKGGCLYDLAQVGMEPATLARFRRMIAAEHGIVLVTGPTGSGKTTTLYAALGQIDGRRRNVLTLEDPVEYRLPGISQTQVNEKKGMTFAGGLRNVLRQDPDIIMVGEVRDRETAVMAIQSALTGHLVFSTLHTNDAASAVARLLDLGIEPYLLASSVIGVLAQRLVRRVCPGCARPLSAGGSGAAAAELARLGLDVQSTAAPAAAGPRSAAGCEACRSTGYRGRVGVFELLTVNEEVRRKIQSCATASEIRAAAVASGMRTLRDDGIGKVLAGATTVEEVLRVTMRDEAGGDGNTPSPFPEI